MQDSQHDSAKGQTQQQGAQQQGAQPQRQAETDKTKQQGGSTGFTDWASI